jgi:uncharacterized membrane protein
MRKLTALAGLILLVVLAAALLWRVYRHHAASDPDEMDTPAIVRLDDGQNFHVKNTHDLS